MTTEIRSPPSAIGPVAAAGRIEAIDTLRGVALLGILVLNITSFAFPFGAYFNPTVYGGSTGLNFGAWVFSHLFFELKMIGIFSMLFGAGIILMTQRAEAAGRPFGRIHYRRMFWLLVIGLIHAYLLWAGDILVTYALCGFVLYLFRRRRPRTLILSGLGFLVFGALITSGGGFAQRQLRNVVQEIEAKVAAGEEMTPRRQALVNQWNGLRHSFAPAPAEIDGTIETMRGDWSTVVKANIEEAVMMHTQAVPFSLFWRAMGMMLLGMALMKVDVFAARRSRRFYRNWMIAGFGLGLPLVAFGIWRWSAHDFDFIYGFLFDGQYNYFGHVLVVMGHISLVMLICQSGKLAALRARLAAVGQTAFSNYLLQTVIGVSLFYGYGLGLFGRIGRFNLWWFILAIWLLQLAISPWWLARYRFGPVEWLWRTLTYWKLQPMRPNQR